MRQPMMGGPQWQPQQQPGGMQVQPGMQEREIFIYWNKIDPCKAGHSIVAPLQEFIGSNVKAPSKIMKSRN